jgi:hypothetical protein
VFSLVPHARGRGSWQPARKIRLSIPRTRSSVGTVKGETNHTLGLRSLWCPIASIMIHYARSAIARAGGLNTFSAPTIGQQEKTAVPRVNRRASSAREPVCPSKSCAASCAISGFALGYLMRKARIHGLRKSFPVPPGAPGQVRVAKKIPGPSENDSRYHAR